MQTPYLHRMIRDSFFSILKKDRTKVTYLLYYSILETLLLLTLPFASSFIINSLLAHASLSLLVLGLIVTVLLFTVMVIQVIKEYIIEKFQQNIFVSNAIEVGRQADGLCPLDRRQSEKYMNFFFDILSLQKIVPMIVLDGAGLAMKIFVSLLLLLAFNPWLFVAGSFFFLVFVGIFFLLGRHGFGRAVERSDAKHEAIYTLQQLPHSAEPSEVRFKLLDGLLEAYVVKRKRMFELILRQLSWAYFMEGILISGFLILGGMLVIKGALPVGEFVAAEILIISLINAIHSFVKQLDYIYDMVEGIYKIDKLSHMLEETSNAR